MATGAGSQRHGRVAQACAAFASQGCDQIGDQARQLAGGNRYIGIKAAVVLAVAVYAHIEQHDPLDLQAFSQHKAHAVVPGHGQLGRQFAVLDVLAHHINIQRVAGVAHHRLGLICGFGFRLAASAEAGRRLLGHQPMRHGGLWADLRVQQCRGKAGQALD